MLISKFSLVPAQILKIVNDHRASKERQKMIDDYRYFKGDNVFISTVQKLYWSDEKKCVVVNPYKSNVHIGYSFFGKIVKQKNLALLDEPPQIIPKNKGQDVTFLTAALGDNWGNILKEFAEQAGTKGKGYIFRGTPKQNQIELVVFETENTIEFTDEYTGEIQGLYRYWTVSDREHTERLIVEVYSLDGLTVFAQTKESSGVLTVKQELTPYREGVTAYNGVIDPNSRRPIPIKRLPIIKLPNNKQEESDLTPNIKGKIDAIDVVQSDYANNLSDFNDIFWIIKNPAATSDEIQDWAAQIAKKKAVVTDSDGGAEAKTVAIPYEARAKFAADMKADLREETGVIDSSMAANVTATAIEFAAKQLEIRVSDFEYPLYKASRELIDSVLEALGVQLEYTLIFNKKMPFNATELATLLAMLQTDMSLVDRLRILKKLNLIESVEETQKALDEEAAARYGMQGVSDDEPTDESNPDEVKR